MTVTIPHELGKVYKHLEAEMSEASYGWQTFRLLFTTSKERCELMEATAAQFFESLDFMLRDLVIITICRITDPPEQGKFDNLVIDRLHLGLDPARDSTVIGELEHKAKAVHASCEDLREHRRKRIAHFDMPTILAGPDAVLPGLKVKSIGDALDAIGDYLNHFARYVYDSETYYKKVLCKTGVDTLVYFLKRGVAFTEMERDDWTLMQRVESGPFGKA